MKNPGKSMKINENAGNDERNIEVTSQANSEAVPTAPGTACRVAGTSSMGRGARGGS